MLVRATCRNLRRLCHCPSDVLYTFNPWDNSYSYDMYTYPRISKAIANACKLGDVAHAHRTEYQIRRAFHAHLFMCTYIFQECL